MRKRPVETIGDIQCIGGAGQMPLSDPGPGPNSRDFLVNLVQEPREMKPALVAVVLAANDSDIASIEAAGGERIGSG